MIDPETFDQKVWELVLQYNYTLNPQGVYEAIKYMYTYWPDPMNVTHIRDQYINVSNRRYIKLKFSIVTLLYRLLLIFSAIVGLSLCRAI